MDGIGNVLDPLLSPLPALPPQQSEEPEPEAPEAAPPEPGTGESVDTYA